MCVEQFALFFLLYLWRASIDQSIPMLQNGRRFTPELKVRIVRRRCLGTNYLFHATHSPSGTSRSTIRQQYVDATHQLSSHPLQPRSCDVPHGPSIGLTGHSRATCHASSQFAGVLRAATISRFFSDHSLHSNRQFIRSGHVGEDPEA